MVVHLVPGVWWLVVGDFAFCGYLAWCLLYLVCLVVVWVVWCLLVLLLLRCFVLLLD